MHLTPLPCCTPASALRAAVVSGLLGLVMVSANAGAADTPPLAAVVSPRMVAAVGAQPGAQPTAAEATATQARAADTDSDDTDPPGRSLALLVASLAAAVFVIRGRLR